MKIKLRTSPWSHQRDAIRFALARPGALLAMEMGTGKSLCAIAAIGATPDRSRTLILCPKKVLDVWPIELDRHAGFEYRLETRHDSADRRAKRISAAFESCGSRLIVGVNYEAAITRQLVDCLLGHRWDLAILDESHRAKGAKGATGRLVHDLGKVSARRLCLSGTPTPHSPLDIFAQARFLAPEVFGESWTRFCARYAVSQPVPEKWIGRELRPNERPPTRIVGVRNLPEIEARMSTFTFRVKASDVLDLPEAHHVIRPVTLGATASGIYRDLEESCYALVRDAAGNKAALQANGALAQLLKLQAVTGGQVADENGKVQRVGTEKLETLAELLEDLGPKEPVVVFARFRTELAQIHEAAAAAELKSLEISGQRSDYLEWREPNAPTVLAVQIQSGGAGIDLTRASKCVYWSSDWSLGNYAQSLARLHRPGQKRTVTYFHLHARHDDDTQTVDGEIYQALANRSDFIESFLRRVTERVAS